jgi:hypothetical protein
MKLTKKQLKKIIKEELESIMGSGAIPIEELEFTRGEKMEVYKADGEDAIRVLRDKAAFNDWKARVGPGTMVKQGIRGVVWEPVSGPWKKRYDQLKSAKGRSVGRYGSN